MYKLLVLSFLFTSSLFSQKAVYSGSDENLEYKVTIEKHTDQVNDVFYEFYNLEIKNTSNSTISFTPIFNYKNDEGEILNSSNHDDYKVLTLAPGKTLKGSYSDSNNLTLFKEFLIGNSGRKASESKQSLESVIIKY